MRTISAINFSRPALPKPWPFRCSPDYRKCLKPNLLRHLRPTNHSRKGAGERSNRGATGLLSLRWYSARVPETNIAVEGRDVDFLYQVSRVLLTELDYGELLSTVLDTVIKGLGAERGFILVREADAFRATVARNYLAESLTRAEERVSTTIASKVAESGHTFLSGNAQEEPSLRRQPSVNALGLRSVLCAPLLLTSEATALLYLENRTISNCFQEEHRSMLDEVCKLAAPRLHTAVLLEANRRRLAELQEIGECDGILTTDERMLALLQNVRRLAATDLPILIEGETGTGKELIARALYRHSARSRGPFVVLNCGAIPAALIESELFGYVRGAFTGANQDRLGFIAAAHRGTVFLDEIGELPLELQPRLLRVLQSGEFTRLGSVRTESADVRFIAATNRELEREVDEGRFRSDLFYRISGITLKIPPLRERGNDIHVLAAHFLSQQARRLARPVPILTAEALKVLAAYTFPGNVRELESEMARLLATSLPGATLKAESLSERVRGVARSATPPRRVQPMSIAEMEKHLITSVLEHTAGNRTRAAEVLGISREGLRNKLQRMGLKDN